MADLESLDRFVDTYVCVTEPDGEGLAGWVVSVEPVEVRGGVRGRELVVDYGYGWFVTENTEVRAETPREERFAP